MAKYPCDGEIIGPDGKGTGEMGWIAEELTGEKIVGVPRKRFPPSKPPATWGPEKRRLARLAREREARK